MLNQRRPGLRARRDVLKLVGRLNHACAGVYADVIEPGEVRVGDPVYSIRPSAPRSASGH
jgi:MOSC domain-containing protein YiiM